MNRFWPQIFFPLWLAAVTASGEGLTAAQLEALPQAAKGEVDFRRDIKPLLEASCIKCHARGRNKGGFQLDTRATLLRGGDSGPAVVSGQSSKSLLIALVAGVDPDNVMPRKGSRLTPAQVGRLRAWIDAGLPWDSSVTFARPAPLNLTPTPSKLKLAHRGSVNPIDQMLKAYFAAHHFKPPVVVEDRLFARRAYLDVVGLLPPPAELQAFLADHSPDKRSKLVGRLLADNQRYAVHWLSFWNDLLRNDYRGTGFIDGGREQITGWLYSALLTNAPYNRFVAELIDPTPECEGFTKGIVWRGAVNASQTPAMQAAQNISQVFMGVNLKCASCHDSFVNDWRLADAYGLASVYSDGPLELFQCDKPTGQTAEARFIYPVLGEMDPKADKRARLQRLAEIVTAPRNGRLPRTIVNRLWARCFGRGLIEPVDDMEQTAWDQDLLDWLAEDLAANGYDLKRTIEWMLSSRAYQLPALDLGEAAAKGFVFQGPGIRRMTAEQFRDALGQVAGVWCDNSALPGVTNQVRASLVPADPLAAALGRPDREQIVTTRASAATTLQALQLTNGETLADLLQQGAQNLLTSPPSPADLTDRIYESALCRNPNGLERLLASDLLGQPIQRTGLEDLLWAVVMLPEFQLIY